jgi:hypothetical protein
MTCYENIPSKLKKAILTFLIVDQLDQLINPTEEKSIAVGTIK